MTSILNYDQAAHEQALYEDGREEGILIFIEDKREDGIGEDIIKQRLIDRFKLTAEEADLYLKCGGSATVAD